MKCDKCLVKIPRSHAILCCSECSVIKHLKCQKLSKLDAQHIINLGLKWTCNECLLAMLPINVCKVTRTTVSKPQFKVPCNCCNGFCYSPASIRTCYWCESTVHAKCFKENLGCIHCCENNIPGFYVTSYELYMMITAG